MNDNIKNLLELINEYPDLPVVCMVDCKIVCDDYGWGMAQIGWSEVGEFASYNGLFYDEREEFIGDYYNVNNEVLHERFGYDEEAREKIAKHIDEVADRSFKKAILVYLKELDEMEEFEDETDI